MAGLETEESEYGQRVKFVIETDQIGENGQPLEIWHYCSAKLSKKSKLAKTATGILGIKYAELPDNFDIDTLIGKKTQITEGWS